MIDGLDHIALAVNDLSSSVEDYRRFLGRDPAWVQLGERTREAWFQLDEVGLRLIASAPLSDPVADVCFNATAEGPLMLAFAVSDLAHTQARMARRGLRFLADARPAELTPSDPRPSVRIDPRDTASVPMLLVALAADRPARSAPADVRPGAVLGLDHVVIRTAEPDRAAAIYGARLGLDLRLDRSNQQWGARQLFFRCGGAVVEVVAPLQPGAAVADDHLDGLAWRVDDAMATHRRLSEAAFDVSTVRTGRKPGSIVLTVRSGVAAAPALMIQQGQRIEQP